jgi:hypothetical protein
VSFFFSRSFALDAEADSRFSSAHSGAKASGHKEMAKN